jgi:hypothetical protein
VLLLALAALSGGCATTPEARWAADRSRLTAATAILADLAEAGQLPPEALPPIDRTLKAIRGHLARAQAQLPEGGEAFDYYLDAARAALDELWALYIRKEPADGPRDPNAAAATGRATAGVDQARD